MKQLDEIIDKLLYDLTTKKPNVVVEAKQAIQAYIDKDYISKDQLEEEKTKAKKDELELIISKKTREDANDNEYGQFCDNCHMMLETVEDKCGCDYVTRDRLKELKGQ